jgi:hypothetical protein
VLGKNLGDFFHKLIWLPCSLTTRWRLRVVFVLNSFCQKMSSENLKVARANRINRLSRNTFSNCAGRPDEFVKKKRPKIILTHCLSKWICSFYWVKSRPKFRFHLKKSAKQNTRPMGRKFTLSGHPATQVRRTRKTYFSRTS